MYICHDRAIMTDSGNCLCMCCFDFPTPPILEKNAPTTCSSNSVTAVTPQPPTTPPSRRNNPHPFNIKREPAALFFSCHPTFLRSITRPTHPLSVPNLRPDRNPYLWKKQIADNRNESELLSHKSPLYHPPRLSNKKHHPPSVKEKIYEDTQSGTS